MNLSIESIILIAIVGVAAYTIKGLVGFGQSLIMTPILALFLDFKTVIIIVAFADLLSSTLVYLQQRKEVELKKVGMILIAMIIGTYLGVNLLQIMDMSIVKKFFGIFILLVVIRNLFIRTKNEDKKFENKIAFMAGFAGGITGGLFNTNGPLIVLYLNSIMKNKSLIRANLSFIFAVDALWRTTLYVSNNMVSLNNLALFCLIILPGLFIGLGFANMLIKRINGELLVKVINSMLFVVGTGLLLR